MPLRNWNLDWLVHNAARAYPLSAECTGTDTTGSFTLPKDFIVGLELPVNAAIDADPDSFFIHQIGAYSTGYTVIVAYDDGASYIDVATALIPRYNFVRNSTYALGGIAPFDDTVGKITIGRLETLDLQPSGMWTFDHTTARLEPDCIRPILRGISSVLVRNGTEQSVRMTGDIELVPGRNIELTVDAVAGTIRIDAVEGANLTEPCTCLGDDSPCIKQVNGVRPTADGKIHLVSGSDCVQITSTGNQVQITDTCSKPCCGCDELEAITRDLERFLTERNTLTKFLDQLQVAVQGMSLTVLGTKLSDRGCITCS